MLAAAQLGQRIKVRVTFTDGGGTQETLTSLARGAVVAAGTANQEPTGLPTISGTVREHQTLTANTDGIADADGLTRVGYSYEWLVDDTAVSEGGTGRAYTVTASDVGKRIKVRVTFTDDRGHVETLTSAETATVPAQPNDGDVWLNVPQGRLFMYRERRVGHGLPMTVWTVWTECPEKDWHRWCAVSWVARGAGSSLFDGSGHTSRGPSRSSSIMWSVRARRAVWENAHLAIRRTYPCGHSQDVAIGCTDETVSDRPLRLLDA